MLASPKAGRKGIGGRNLYILKRAGDAVEESKLLLLDGSSCCSVDVQPDEEECPVSRSKSEA